MKKIFSIIAALLAGVMMFSCADQMEDALVLGTEISADTEKVEFKAEKNEPVVVNVTSNGTWMVAAPQWLKVTPMMGEAGTTAVTITATDNMETVVKEDGSEVVEMAAPRAYDLIFAGEDASVKVSTGVDKETGEETFKYVQATATVKVSQVGDPEKAKAIPVSIAEFNAAAEDATKYQLKGVITSIANDHYGNIYIEDDTASTYIYGLYMKSETGELIKYDVVTTLGLKVGDTLVVEGTRGSYKDTIEMIGALYVSHTPGEGGETPEEPEEPETPVESTVITIPELYAKVAEATGVISKDVTYVLNVVVSGASQNSSYGSLYVMTKGATEAGNGFLLYDSSLEGKYNVGDELKVTLPAGVAQLDVFNGNAQVKNVTAENIEVLSTGNVVNNIVVTADQLPNYLGMPVTVENASVAADGVWGNADSNTSHTFTAGGTDFTVYINKRAEAFLNVNYYAQTGNISGIAVTYKGSLQLAPRDAEDVKAFANAPEQGGDEPETPEEPEPEITTSTFGAITEAGDYKVENAVVVNVTLKGYLLYDGTGYAYVNVGSKTDYVVGTKMTVIGTVSYYYDMMQIAPTAVEDVTTVEGTHPEAEVMDGAAIDAYMSNPTYKYVKVTGKLSVGRYTNLIVEGTTNTVSVSYFDGDLSAMNDKDVTLYGYLGGSNTTNGYVTMYLVSCEEVVAEPEEPGTGEEATTYTMTLTATAGVISSNINGLPSSWKENDATWTATDDSGASTITFTGNIYHSKDESKNVVWYFNKGKAETHVSASDLGTVKKVILYPNSDRKPQLITCTTSAGDTVASVEAADQSSATITWDFEAAGVTADNFRLDYNDTTINIECGKVVIEYTK